LIQLEKKYYLDIPTKQIPRVEKFHPSRNWRPHLCENITGDVVKKSNIFCGMVEMVGKIVYLLTG
jgi:hypothetical protein